ncbi:MAG TPA: glycosyltransferase family 2 protein [Firmicutes bacterium]|nr:glycosyltransferase family 2 protein [Candidatus Fermentithermobacillaceae bacterium]
MRLLIKADATKGYLPRGYVSGAAMMVKADVFRSVGLLRDAYFFYGEDKEFLLRARRSGYGVRIIRDAVVHHARGSSSSSRNKCTYQHKFYDAERTFIKRNGEAKSRRSKLKSVGSVR